MKNKILLVDDSKIMIKILKKELSKTFNNNSLDVCCCVKCALKKTDKHPNDFAVVILDYQMPGANGRNVLRKMREAKLRCPAILYSGYNFDGYRPSGFDAYVSKTSSLTILINTLRRMIGERQDLIAA